MTSADEPRASKRPGWDFLDEEVEAGDGDEDTLFESEERELDHEFIDDYEGEDMNDGSFHCAFDRLNSVSVSHQGLQSKSLRVSRTLIVRS